MTTQGLASGATQVHTATPPDRVSEPPAVRLKQEQDRRAAAAPEAVTEPEELPSQTYDNRGRVVPSPSLTSIDRTA
jgi:hypothetical protein